MQLDVEVSAPTFIPSHVNGPGYEIGPVCVSDCVCMCVCSVVRALTDGHTNTNIQMGPI